MRLEVICGPMFCGKTEELIRRVRRATIAGKKVMVFKHKLDTRYATKNVISHDGGSFKAIPVSSASQILNRVSKDTEIVAIDETQWFGKSLIPVCQRLLDKGKRVIVAGLATTYEGKPFPPMPHLMAIADEVVKLSAICNVCGQEATFHIKKQKSKIDPAKITSTLVGGTKEYEARCRNCFKKS